MNILYKMIATRKNRKTRTSRMKKGGAGETMDFNNLAELHLFSFKIPILNENNS